MPVSHYKHDASLEIIVLRHAGDNDPASRLYCQNSQCLHGTGRAGGLYALIFKALAEGGGGREAVNACFRKSCPKNNKKEDDIDERIGN